MYHVKPLTVSHHKPQIAGIRQERYQFICVSKSGVMSDWLEVSSLTADGFVVKFYKYFSRIFKLNLYISPLSSILCTFIQLNRISSFIKSNNVSRTHIDLIFQQILSLENPPKLIGLITTQAWVLSQNCLLFDVVVTSQPGKTIPTSLIFNKS